MHVRFKMYSTEVLYCHWAYGICRIIGNYNVHLKIILLLLYWQIIRSSMTSACPCVPVLKMAHRQCSTESRLSLPTALSPSLTPLAFLLSPLPSHLLLLSCHHKIVLSTWILALSSPKDVEPCPLVYQVTSYYSFHLFQFQMLNHPPPTQTKIAFSISGNTHGFCFVRSTG